MKEPQVGLDGMIRWNGVCLTPNQIAELKLFGYEWFEEGECYRYKIPKYPDIGSDEFQRAQKPQYGDCK